MAMPRKNFTVYIKPADASDEPAEHEVTVIWPDRLVAEQAYTRMGINGETQHHAVLTAWCWAALRRTGVYTGELGEFRTADCLHIENEEGTEEDADPTQKAAPTGSA